MAAGVAGERDAKLSSVLALSPGKEYWAGRIAGRGPRGSTSPPTASVFAHNSREMTKKKKNDNTLGGIGGGGSGDVTAAAAAASSPEESSAPSSFSPVRVELNSGCAPSRGLVGRQQHQYQAEEEASGRGSAGVFSVGSSAGPSRRKDYWSFTAGKRGAPLSPGGAGAGGGSATSSVWSTQQAFGSPGGMSLMAGSLGGGGRGSRLDPSSWRPLQLGEARSPSSPLSLSLSPARGHRRRGISPAGRRIALEENAAVDGLPAARWSGRVSSPKFSPTSGGGSSFGTPSFRFNSPGKASLGTSFGGGSQCSFSSLQTQVM